MILGAGCQMDGRVAYPSETSDGSFANTDFDERPLGEFQIFTGFLSGMTVSRSRSNNDSAEALALYPTRRVRQPLRAK